MGNFRTVIFYGTHRVPGGVYMHPQHNCNDWIHNMGPNWYQTLEPHCYIDGLVHDCSISSALAIEILQSCTKPSIFAWIKTLLLVVLLLLLLFLQLLSQLLLLLLPLPPTLSLLQLRLLRLLRNMFLECLLIKMTIWSGVILMPFATLYTNNCDLPGFISPTPSLNSLAPGRFEQNFI